MTRSRWKAGNVRVELQRRRLRSRQSARANKEWRVVSSRILLVQVVFGKLQQRMLAQTSRQRELSGREPAERGYAPLLRSAC